MLELDDGGGLEVDDGMLQAGDEDCGELWGRGRLRLQCACGRRLCALGRCRGWWPRALGWGQERWHTLGHGLRMEECSRIVGGGVRGIETAAGGSF
jgi:hypothetical protein